MVGSSCKRVVVSYLKEAYKISQRRVCKAIKFPRSTCRYKTVRTGDNNVREQLKHLAGKYRRYGYRRLWVLLRREGNLINHKRIYRIYREEKLSVKKKTRKKLPSHLRVVSALPSQPNERWSMDFVSDRLSNGRRIKVLTVVDDFTKESPLIHTDISISGDKVAALFKELSKSRTLPRTIVCDNGPEFISKSLDAWAYLNNIKLDFIRPGKPVDNCFIESFNGKFRDELLNENVFHTLEHARLLINNWWDEYNNFRPHSSLKNKTPMDFLRSFDYKNTEPAKLNVG
jgi:putative transposase